MSSGDGLGARPREPLTEVIVTLRAPALSSFGRSLQSATHRTYLRQIDAAQTELARRITTALPDAQVRWRYRLVADGLAVALPRSQAALLARVPGVARVWPNIRFHALRDTAGPQQIGADKLWGPTFATAGNGMKIGIIDDGLQAAHPYFDASGFQYPPGFPKGQTQYTTPKVIVQRTFAPPSPSWKYANVPFDPQNSFHATHVAGIAAGDFGAQALGNTISGVAPNAYLGNYKALTTPTPVFGLDGNAAEITAAIEAAVSDGMNVINLSLGEPEVEPSRDIVVQAINGAAAAGVVPVVAAGNDFSDFGYGSVSSPGSAPDAITVAAVTSRDTIAGFSSAGPTPISLEMKPDLAAPGVDVVSSLPTSTQTWGLLSGTSMATPHVAGAAALLLERHPGWTVAQVKSALVQTADPVRSADGTEVPTTREGGGVVDLPRADVPLLFASPTGLSFGELRPSASAARTVTLTDAGGGPAPWTVTVAVQAGAATVTTEPQVAAPGTLTVTATAGATTGDVTGFIVLTRDSDVRRIPFWFEIASAQLARERAIDARPPGHRPWDERRRAVARLDLPLPDGRRSHVPGPGTCLPAAGHWSTRELRCRGAEGPRHAARHGGRRREQAHRLHRVADRRQSLSQDLRRPSPDGRRGPAGAGELRPRARLDVRVRGGAVHDPLVAERHDAPDVAAAADSWR